MTAASFSLTTAELAEAASAALSVVPCHCGPEYYERALAAPDCRHHDLADDMAQWFRCRCAGCERLAAAVSQRRGYGGWS
jgi:hypothetical protein